MNISVNVHAHVLCKYNKYSKYSHSSWFSLYEVCGHNTKGVENSPIITIGSHCCL